MSKISLTGESSGYVEISAGNAAGNNTLEAPTSGTRLVAHEGSQDVTLNGNLTVNGVVSYEDVTNIDSVGIITARDEIILKSSVNNQQPKLKIESYGEYGEIKADGNGSLILDADPDFNSNDSYIGFKVDGSEKARIDSTGNIGIGTETIQANINYNTLEIVGDAGTTGGGIVRLKTGNLAAKTMLFCDTGGFEARVETNHPFVISTNDTERLRITSDGTVRLPDNGKLTLGAGDDLQIWSDNTDQYIRGEQNQLIVRSNNLRLQSYLGENYIHCAMNNAVSLYYDNVKKFETTTAGLTIHEDTDKTISFTGGIGEIGNVTGFQAVNTAGSALVDFGMRANTLRFATGSAERLRINSAGEVYIGSTAANGQGKLFVNDSSGATTTRVHIRNAVSTGNAETYYNLDGTKFASVGLEDGDLVFRNSTSSTPTERLRIHSHGQLELKVPDANPALKITPGGTNAPATIDFNTPGTGVAKLLVQGTEKLRITSDGALYTGYYGGLSGRFVFHNADQSGGADTTYSKDMGLYVRNDCGPTHVDLTGIDNFTAKLHNGAYAGSGVSDPQGSISKLLFHACTYNGYNAYGAISLDVQGANYGRGDLVFLNGGNNTSISERLRITGGGILKINPAELQTTAGDKFAQIRGGGIINTKRLATGHFGNTAAYQPQQYGYIGDYMHYGCNAVYYLAQTSTGNSGYSSHMFSWYDSGHWGHYGKFVLMCHESSYIGGMAHRYLSGTTVTDIFNIGNTGSVSTTSTTTGSGTHSGQSVTRYDCTVSHTSTYRTMRWYLGLFHGFQLGVTGNGKTQSEVQTYANSNGSILHLFGVSDSN